MGRLVVFLLGLIVAMGTSWAQTSSSRATREPAKPSQQRARQDPAIVAPAPATTAMPRDSAVQLDNETRTIPRGAGTPIERPRVAEELKSDSVTRTRPGDAPAAADRSPAAKAADTSTAGDGAETGQERPNRTGSAPTAAVSAREHVLVTRRIKNDASRLSEQSFAQPSDLHTHRKAIATLETAAKSLEDKARRLQPLDFAAAEFQIDHASRIAARVNSAATAGQIIGGQQVEAVQRAARTVEPIAKRMAAGQRPLPVRWVSVRVGQKETADEVKGLQVYVLPGAVLDEPALYSASDIRKLLTHFSFTGLTSPAVQELAVFDTRVWVGPRMKYDEMVGLVGQGKVKKFRVIDKPTVGDAPIELTFVAPDDLVQP